MRTLDDVIGIMTRNRGGDEAAMADWATKFTGSPAYTLEWSSDLVKRAAKLELTVQVLAFLTGEVNPDYTGDRLECVVTEFQRDVRRMAGHLNQSTSPMSNLVNDCRRVVKAEMLEWLIGERGFY